MRSSLGVPHYGTSLHYPHCNSGPCTGCLPPDNRPAVGVCGFGRCGSSMTMAMLDAGGLAPAMGSQMGSYELRDIRDAWSVPLAGRAVKLLESVLHFGVPDAPEWRFVWLDRDPVEQAKSQLKLMAPFVGPFKPDAIDRLARSYEADRPRALRLLRRRGEVLVMQYERVLASPRKAAKQLRQVFPDLEVDAAAAAVHDRDGRCREDLDVELGRTTTLPNPSAGDAR